MMNTQPTDSLNSSSTLEVIVVGAGTGVPVVQHSPACVYVRCGSFRALMDLGPGSLSRLPQYGVDPFGLENIFITHLHPDHVLDLAVFYQMSNYDGSPRGELPLDIYGCAGTQKFSSKLMGLFPDIDQPPFEIRFHEMANDIHKKDGMTISSILSGHTRASIAFRLDFNTRSLVYTGDCIKSDDLLNFCRHSDILICECSFPEDWEAADHMNTSHLGTLAREAQVGQLLVVHQYPPALGVDLTSQLHHYYSGPITLAQDGTRVTLPAAHASVKKP